MRDMLNLCIKKEAQLLALQEAVNRVNIDPTIMTHIASLVQATRNNKKFRLGAARAAR
jgi:hypothetical protein